MARPGRVAQLVVSLIADPGVVSLIRQNMQIYHEIFLKVILLFLLIQEDLSVTSKSMFAEYWLAPI